MAYTPGHKADKVWRETGRIERHKKGGLKGYREGRTEEETERGRDGGRDKEIGGGEEWREEH